MMQETYNQTTMSRLQRTSPVVFSFVVLTAGIFFPFDTGASACDLVIAPGSLVVAQASVMLGQRVKIYVTLDGVCGDDIEGAATFFEQGSAIGSKPFSIRSSGKSEEVWMSWIPSKEGSREIRVDAVGSTDNPPLSLNRSASIGVIVDRDTDSDGIPDRIDTDRDNDGLSDEEEAKIKTDPLRMDTDQDGMDDKRDAFPLDPDRTKLPSPPLPPPPPILPPAPVLTPTHSPASAAALPTKVIARPSSAPATIPAIKRDLAPQVLAPMPTRASAGAAFLTEPSTTASVIHATSTETGTTTAAEVLIIPIATSSIQIATPAMQNPPVEKSTGSVPLRTQILMATAAASAGLAGFFLWKSGVKS